MIDLEELLISQGITYTDHGHYLKIKCINPAHEDKTPSMTILKENGYAKCWSCGAIYNYGQFIYALTGDSPFKSTKDKYSFRFNNSLVTVSKRKTFKKKERKFIMKGELKNPYNNKEVLNFLHQMNTTNKTIDFFNIKYMLKGKMGFIEDSKLTPIYNRICIPLYDNKKLVNYECRDFTGRSKPKVLYPKGGKSDILFNVDNLDFTKPLYIVEGIKSALRIYSLGYTNVTATLGASVGKNQLFLINRMKYPIVFPDNDDAGQAMLKQIEENTDVDLYVTFMNKQDYDPADGTIEELTIALNSYINVTKYYINKYDIFGKQKLHNLDW